MLKTFLQRIYYASPTLHRIRFTLRFIRRNRYIPNIKNPRTYSEKTNFRKRYPLHPLFSVCSDKIAVKDYVSERVSEDIIIPTYYVGESVTLEILREILKTHGSCVLKANHESGTVYILHENDDDEVIQEAVRGVLKRLAFDYGRYFNEPWYSEISPRAIVEKKLEPDADETSIKDYKFHVFKRADGSFKIIVGIDFDRDRNHTRSFYLEDLTWIPMTIAYPSIHTRIAKPPNYDEMLRIVRKLAEPFSYVRVDLYNIRGKIYFGELTFAHGSGGGAFNSFAYDRWLGGLWEGDPRY